jgi:hypothetical protein
MPQDMLALGAGALGVATIVLLVLRSYWAHRRVRAGPQKRRPVAMVTENAIANSEGPTAVAAGPTGSSTAFRHPARHTTAKEVVNRSLTIHFFGLHKGGTRTLAHGK